MRKFYALITENSDGNSVFVIDESSGLAVMSPNYNTICRYQVSFANDYPHRDFMIKEMFVEGSQGFNLKI